jgi:mannan endo-1,4-beta-mannosidase
MDILADFMNTLKTKEGTKVPVLFRPWHEHTGKWFWWGKNLCAAEQYKELRRMTWYGVMPESGKIIIMLLILARFLPVIL